MAIYVYDYDHFAHFADDWHCFFVVARTLLSSYCQVKLKWFSGRRLPASMSSTVKQLNKILTGYDRLLIQIDRGIARCGLR